MNSSELNFLPNDDELLRRESIWMEFFKNLEMAENGKLAPDDFDESHSANEEDENSSDAMSVQSCEDDNENFNMQQVVAEMQPVIDRRVADWPAKGVNLQLKKVDPKVTVREWLRANAEWTTTKEKYKKTVVEENNKKIRTTVKRTTTKTFQSFGFPNVQSYRNQNHKQNSKLVTWDQLDSNHESSTKKTHDDISLLMAKKPEFTKEFDFKKPVASSSAKTEKTSKPKNDSSAKQIRQMNASKKGKPSESPHDDADIKGVSTLKQSKGKQKNGETAMKQLTHQNVLRGEMETSADYLIITRSRSKKLEKAKNKVSSVKPIQPKGIQKNDGKNVKSAMALQTEIIIDSVQTPNEQKKQENSKTVTNRQMQQNVRQRAIENSIEVSTNMKKGRKIGESTMLRNGDKTFDTTKTLGKQSEVVNREMAEKFTDASDVDNSSVIAKNPEKQKKLEKSAKQIEQSKTQKPQNNVIIGAVTAVDEMWSEEENGEIATKPPIQANVIQNTVENSSRSSTDINRSKCSSKSLKTTGKAFSTEQTRSNVRQRGRPKIPSKTKVSIEVVSTVDEMHRLGSSEIAKQSEIQPKVDQQTDKVNSKCKKQLQSDTVQKASTSAESNKLDGPIGTIELSFQTDIIESNQNREFISSPNRKAGTKKKADRTQKQSNNRNHIQLQQKNSFEDTSQSVYSLSRRQNTMLDDYSSCDSEEDDVLMRCYKNKGCFWKIG